MSISNVEGFNLNKISSEGIEGEISLKIKNPNAVGFSIYPSEFDIVFSGIHIGKAKLHKRVHISANTEKVYTFKLKSSLEGINFLEIAQLLNSSKAGRIEIKGDLKAGKFLMRRKYPVNYSDKVKLFK